MAEPAAKPRPIPFPDAQNEEDDDLLSYDGETEEALETFADALAGLPD